MSLVNEDRKYFRYLLYLILGTTIFRLIYINLLNLAPQEAYYWNYSRHLALSYLDHPPVLAYLIFLFTHLGSQSEFFVRIACVLIASGLTYLTYLIGKLLFDPKVGFFSALLLNSILIFSLGAIIATPDTPMIFFWVLSFYFFSKLILTQKKKWWYLWGISTGLGLLSKYTSVFIIFSVFLYLVFSKQNRRWLLSKEPYLALILAILMFSPVIIWNAQNNWVSFLFQSSRRATELGSFSAWHFFGYLGAQIGVVSPLIYFSLIYAVIKSGIMGFKRKTIATLPPHPIPLPKGERGHNTKLPPHPNPPTDFASLSPTGFASLNLPRGEREYSKVGESEKFLLCFFWSFPIILFFTLVATKYWVKMNWVSAGYFSASISLVALFFQFLEKGKNWIKTWGISALIVSLIFVLIAHILPLMKVVPVSSSLDTVTGWKELAQRVEGEKSKMREGTIVVGYGYKVPSEIAFYTSLETYSNNIVGQNGLQFDFWSNPKDFLGKDAIFVYDQRERYKNPENLKNFFASFEEKEPLKIYRGGKVLTTFHIFKCYEYKGPGN
jgi:4-amino-4-deoxy-L-arabinose transferase-like glycosyltransferase